MTKLFLVPALSLSLVLLASCGKDKEPEGSNNTNTNSVTTDGRCTQQYVNDYNDVNRELRSLQSYLKYNYTQSEIDRQASKAQNACRKFYAAHGTTACRAEVDYKETLVGWSDLQSNCKVVDDYIASP